MSKKVFGYTKEAFMRHMLVAYSGRGDVVSDIRSVECWEAWFDKHAKDEPEKGKESDYPC